MILVTGAAGFIGSHVVRHAHETGSKVIALDWAEEVNWPKFPDDVMRARVTFEDVAMDSGDLMDDVTGVVHCAGMIDIAESIKNPRKSLRQNVTRTLQFAERLIGWRVEGRPIPAFVFASSAAVYGHVQGVCSDLMDGRPFTPYGIHKQCVERLLLSLEGSGLLSASLRLFNVAGAHPDGTLRECHYPETHLIPNAVDAALGRAGRLDKPVLTIYGNEYPTNDGTAIRDYVHVMDVARAFLLALDALELGKSLEPINIGSGVGSSVWDVVDGVVKNLRRPCPVEIKERREGDPAKLVAITTSAEMRLGWKPERSQLSTIIDDTVRSRRDVGPS